jgi:hypothetical protein
MVNGDDLCFGVAFDGGPVTTSFVGWTGDLGIQPSSSRYGVTVAGEFSPDPALGDIWYRGDYRAPAEWRDAGSPPPPIPDMILTVAPIEVFTEPPKASDGLSSAGAYTELRPSFRALESIPDHLAWDPSLPRDDDEPTPRFFWRDDLEQWRAIGPGKPADDLVLFKIKTAMGLYSEPRPGDEPSAGAHPLRVKIDNGSGADSWDTPVWMEPQD